MQPNRGRVHCRGDAANCGKGALARERGLAGVHRIACKRCAFVGRVPQVDEQRLLTETAIFADKIAVDEETVRLKSHITQLNKLLDEGGVIGRKLDFIVQEMNREANTIGSKCQNLEIGQTVVEIKSEIEKIREQVQNIE